MAEAYIVAAARTAGGRRGGKLAGWHPVDLAAQLIDALVARSGIDPAAVEDVILGCVSQVGRAGDQRGAQRRAGVEPARIGARHVDRPAMRLVAAGAALRGAGRDVGQHGRGDRRRRRKHDARADVLAQRAGGQGGPGHLHEPGDASALPGRRVQPVHRRRDDREAPWPLAGTRSTAYALREPPARHRRQPRRPLRRRDRAGRDPAGRRLRQRRVHTVDEGIRFDATLEAIAGRQADRRRRRLQRRHRQPDLRRRERRAGGQRARAEEPGRCSRWRASTT